MISLIKTIKMLAGFVVVSNNIKSQTHGWTDKQRDDTVMQIPIILYNSTVRSAKNHDQKDQQQTLRLTL